MINITFEFNNVALGEKEIARIDTLNLNYWNHIFELGAKYQNVDAKGLGFLQEAHWGRIILLYQFESLDAELANKLNALQEKYYQYVPVHIPAEFQHNLLVRQNPYRE